MTAVTDPNPKLQKVYQYLKKQNAVKSPTFEDFQTKMQSDPKTAEKVYNYLKDNGKLKARNIDEFSESMGLKKKDVTPTDQTVPSGSVSEPSSQVLESGLTEEQERQRNLQELAQQPVAGEQPVVPTWTEQVQQQMADPLQGGPSPEQKKKEPLGFLDTLSAIWTDLKAAKDKPADPAQTEPSPFLNAIKRGTAMAEQASIINPFEGTDLDDKQITRVTELQKETASLPASPEYQEFNQSKDVGGALSALAKNPVKIIAELTGESMSALVQYGASRIGTGAAAGALIGSVIPGIGTVSGAGGGAVVGMADSSLGLEYSGKFIESLQEQGVDVQDPKDLKRAFEDDRIISNARSSALKKGIPIAMFDLISGGIAGKIASKPAKSLVGRIGQGAAEFGVQAAMGGAGETAGQITSGEQINPSAIIAEMVGELGTTPIEVSNALLTFNRKQDAAGQQPAKPTESPVSEQPVTAASGAGAPKVEAVNTDQPGSEGIAEPVAAEPSGEPVTQNVTDAPVEIKEVDRKDGDIVPRETPVEPAKEAPKQNSGVESQLYRDLEQITGDKDKARKEYDAIKDDAGAFKKKHGNWENTIMKEYGQSGNEYSVKKSTGGKEFVRTKQSGTKQDIIFNESKLRREDDFSKVKKEYADEVIAKEGSPEYAELYDKTVNKLRDLKLHLIHQELIRKQNGEVTTEDNIRSLKEIERLNGIELAKDYYGQPQIFMHSGTKGIKEFKKPGDDGYVQNDIMTGSAGIYFSRNQKQGKYYAEFGKDESKKPGKGKDIYYAFLKTKNPYYMTDPRARADYKLESSETISKKDMEGLKARGYDSVIWDKEGSPKHEVVVFDTEQIIPIGSYNEGLKTANDAPKTDTAKDVPTATETSAEGTVEQPEQKSKVTLKQKSNENEGTNQRGTEIRSIFPPQERKSDGGSHTHVGTDKRSTTNEKVSEVPPKGSESTKGLKPSEQKEKLSEAISTGNQDRSDYVKRRVKDARDNKAFKKGSKDVGYYDTQSMEAANTESDKLIADLQSQLGDKDGLDAAFESLKDNQIPPLMEGPLASKLMLKMQALRMNKKAVEVLDWLQEGGRDSARRLASLQSTASPESTVSRMFAGLEKVKQDALAKPFKGNKTYLDTLKALQDELAAVNKKYDDLLENGTFDKSMLPEPEAPSQSQVSKEIIKKAKALRAEGIADLNKFFKKNRGQANMGAPLDPDLFKALAKILKSYLLEAEGNIIAGYEKFRKDVSAQYPITTAELDANKTDLLNANKETIEEFKAKKQMQVIDKMLAPEGKETPDQRKKRRETAKKILKDFKEGATEDQMAENFADIAGFETVSPEDTAKIVEMTNRYAQYNAEGKNELAYKAWYDLMMFLEDLGLQQRQAHETILDLWYTGVLSGLTTVARSIKGSMLSTGNFTITRLLANPKVAPLAIASMIKGLRGAGGTYRHIMGTGKTSVKLQDFSPRMVRLTDRLWDKSFGDLKARDKFLKGLYALPTFMYRNIIAFDQILKDAVGEGNLAVFEFNNTKEEKTLSDRLKKTQERLQNMRNAEVSALVQDEINVMQKAGEEIPTGYKDRRFRELKNEMRNADHVKRAVEDAARASLVSHPVGTLGQFYSYWEKAMNINDDDAKVTKAGKFALRSIFPFMRIGFNYVNAGLDYTPVGFYRALKQSVWTKEGIRPQEGFERREYLVRASVGMALYTSLLASMFDWDEEEGLKLKPKKDRWIEIYGPLTGKWWEHDDVAKDAKPWTVRFKNPATGEWSGVYSYADNPIGFMLAPLGIMHDEIMFTDFKDKTEKKELKHEEKDMAYLVGAGIHGTFRYAMDQSFNQGLNTIGNLMAPESPEKFGQEVENLVMRPTQGFYPSIYRQLYDQYRAASDTPEKQANHWYEKPAKLMPLVDNIIKNEKYDVFGYPIRRDLNVPLIPDMVLKMAKDNLDYREDLKEWKLLHKFEEVTVGGSFLPPQTYEGKEVTDAQKDEYARIAGMEMRRLVNSHWDALNEMDAERLQKRLLKYKSTARKKAEREALKD